MKKVVSSIVCIDIAVISTIFKHDIDQPSLRNCFIVVVLLLKEIWEESDGTLVEAYKSGLKFSPQNFCLQ